MTYPFTPSTDPDVGLGGAAAVRRHLRLTLATLYGLAGVVLVAALSAGGSTAGIKGQLAVVAACEAVALGLVLGRRVPDMLLAVLPALGAVPISALMVFGGGASGTPFFYLWPVFVAAWFLRGRDVVLTCVACVASLGGAIGLGVDVADGAMAMVVDTAFSVGVSAALVFALRRRLLAVVERLHHTSTHDGLTGLLNRRALCDALESELARARRLDTAMALVVFDVDHFKAINDGFGHEAGDEALVHLGVLLSNDVRAIDSLGRIGGEEFALVLPAADDDTALATAERLCLLVEDATRLERTPLTVSAGVASCRGELDVRALLRAADGALYDAKRTGRNRAVSAFVPVAGSALVPVAG